MSGFSWSWLSTLSNHHKLLLFGSAVLFSLFLLLLGKIGLPPPKPPSFRNGSHDAEG